MTRLPATHPAVRAATTRQNAESDLEAAFAACGACTRRQRPPWCASYAFSPRPQVAL